MILRGFAKAMKISILYLVLSTFMTFSVSRNIQEKDGFPPPAAKSEPNFIKDLKEKLKDFLSSPSRDSKNNDESNTEKETQQKSTDVYESNENIPENGFPQYKFFATPHPSLQNDGFGYDYNDNDVDNNGADNDYDYVRSTKNREGKSDVEIINSNTEENEGTNGEREDTHNDVYIPDCDIPPYPDMLQKRQKTFSENDVNKNNLEEGDLIGNRRTGNGELNKKYDDSDYEQELEDELIKELLGESSGDMTNKEIDKTIEGNIDDLDKTESEIVNVDDAFLKKLLELKNSLGSILVDKTSQTEPNLWNIMKEVSAVLEERFGEVENMHNKMRVRDVMGRAKVRKIQDYYQKSSKDSPEDKDDVLVEVKKARKRLKFITQNNDEDLLPDYMNVLRELVSMLKTTKNVIRGSKDSAIQDEKRLGLDGSDSSTTDTASSTGEGLIDENGAYQDKGHLRSLHTENAKKIRKMADSIDSEIMEKGKINRKQELRNSLKNLKRLKDKRVVDTLDPDSDENVRNEEENMKNKLKYHLKEQIKSTRNKRGGAESSSSEEFESEVTEKDKKKKEKRDKKRKKMSFGKKTIGDL